MADYKGGEIFIDLGGINVEVTSTTNTNTMSKDSFYNVELSDQYANKGLLIKCF